MAWQAEGSKQSTASLSSKLRAFWLVPPTPRVSFPIIHAQNYANPI